MKTILAILCLFFTAEATAQVIFRNDFIINRKQRKLENLGITSITINLGRFPNWNQLINGRGGRTMVIDMRGINSKKVDYSYTELSERVNMPATYTGPIFQRLPLGLTLAPKHAKYSFTFSGLDLPLRAKLITLH